MEWKTTYQSEFDDFEDDFFKCDPQLGCFQNNLQKCQTVNTKAVFLSDMNEDNDKVQMQTMDYDMDNYDDELDVQFVRRGFGGMRGFGGFGRRSGGSGWGTKRGLSFGGKRHTGFKKPGMWGQMKHKKKTTGSWFGGGKKSSVKSKSKPKSKTDSKSKDAKGKDAKAGTTAGGTQNHTTVHNHYGGGGMFGGGGMMSMMWYIPMMQSFRCRAVNAEGFRCGASSGIFSSYCHNHKDGKWREQAAKPQQKELQPKTTEQAKQQDFHKMIAERNPNYPLPDENQGRFPLAKEHQDQYRPPK